MKCFFCDEHNEAFSIIEGQKFLGEIGENNALIHVDAHADDSANSSLRSFYKLRKNGVKKTLKSIKDFAENELLIFSYIKPLILLDTVGEFYWVFPEWFVDEKPEKKILVVGSYRGQGKRIENIPEKKFDYLKKFLYPDAKKFLYSKSKVSGIRETKRPCILDIDFDYFACNDSALYSLVEKFRISKEDFDRLQKSPYFCLSSVGVRRELKQSNGSYFLILRYLEGSRKKVIRKMGNIPLEVGKVFRTLAKKKIQVKLIIGCRSVHSGYTPKKYVRLIEKEIRKNVKKYFPRCSFGN